MFTRSTKPRKSAAPYTTKPNASSYLSAEQGAASIRISSVKEQQHQRALYSSEQCVAEKYAPFPKDLKDALRSSDISKVAGKFDYSTGTGFLLVSKVLYVWNLASSVTCYTFNLPPSQYDIRPDLVTLINSDNKVGLAVCTLEGLVRVWSTLDDQTIYADTMLRVHSEISYVAHSDPHGIVVGTKGGAEPNLYLITPNTLLSKPFRGGSSWFGYILGTTRYPSIVALVPGNRRNNFTEIFVLTDLTLQKWELHQTTEKMQQELTLHANVKGHLLQTEGSEFIVTFLDAKFDSEDSVFVLASYYLAHCPIDAERTVSYLLIHIRAGGSMEIVSNVVVPLGEPQVYNVSQSNNVRLVMPSSTKSVVVCFEDKAFFIQGEAIKEEISFSGDKILACGSLPKNAAQKSALLMTDKLGCVKITDLTESYGNYANTRPEANLPQPANKRESFVLALKAHSEGNKRQAALYISQVGSELPDLAVQISFSFLDSTPNSTDPQWTDTSTSLFLRNQIESKKQKHKILTDFLKEQPYNGQPIWQSLSNSQKIDITENGEKLAAALYLRSVQGIQNGGDVNRETLIQRAIKRTLDERRVEHTRASVSAQDLFYGQISKIDEILGPVYDFLLAVKPATAHVVASLTLAEFREANQIYQAFFSTLSAPVLARHRTHYGVRQLTLRTLGQKYLLLAKDFLRLDLGVLEKEIFQQVFDVTRAVLGSFSYEVDVLGQQILKANYVETREELLKSFLPSHPELAAKLAEEFLDFYTLLHVCLEIPDLDQIYTYMRRFTKEKFPEFVFEYFYQHKKYNELVSLPSEFNNELMEFLRPYPSLSWLQFLRCQHYSEASAALKAANAEEKTSLGRKKILLSLAKLSNLAESITAPSDLSVEQQMYMLRLQKTILPKKTVPLDPVDLIRDILISSPAPVIQNVLSALDVAKNCTKLISVDERTQLIERIWYFSLEHGLSWNDLLPDWRSGRLDDSILRQKIESSVIYGAAAHPNNKGLLPREMFGRVLAALLQSLVSSRDQNDEQFFSRVLQSIYSVVLPLPACVVENPKA